MTRASGKPELMRKFIAQAGASTIFLPAYSPDMNPIDLCWSKLKAALKDFGARADDAAGWFKHCGYGAPASERRITTGLLGALLVSAAVQRRAAPSVR